MDDAGSMGAREGSISAIAMLRTVVSDIRDARDLLAERLPAQLRARRGHQRR